MDDKRFDRLIKLMMLSTSSMDGEALAALRRANLILAEENLSWEEFIRNGIKVTHETRKEKTQEHRRSANEQSQYEQARREYESWKRRQEARKERNRGFRPEEPNKVKSAYDNEVEINRMFDELMRVIHPGDSFLEFITSLYSYFKINGYLTYGQYDALYRAYMRRR